MTPPHETFGQYVREKRTGLNITLRQMARDIEISPTYLSQIEHGNFPPPSEDKIHALAKKLKLDVDDLLARANKVPSDLKPIFTKQPKPVANFLRTAKGLSEADWEKLIQKALQLQEKQSQTRGRGR